jgi:hypothetical protein
MNRLYISMSCFQSQLAAQSMTLHNQNGGIQYQLSFCFFKYIGGFSFIKYILIIIYTLCQYPFWRKHSFKITINHALAEQFRGLRKYPPFCFIIFLRQSKDV